MKDTAGSCAAETQLSGWCFKYSVAVCALCTLHLLLRKFRWEMICAVMVSVCECVPMCVHSSFHLVCVVRQATVQQLTALSPAALSSRWESADVPLHPSIGHNAPANTYESNNSLLLAHIKNTTHKHKWIVAAETLGLHISGILAHKDLPACYSH